MAELDFGDSFICGSSVSRSVPPAWNWMKEKTEKEILSNVFELLFYIVSLSI